MSEIIEYRPQNQQVATAGEIKAQVQRIQEVMRAVMKDKTHYGTIPGTDKPSLWKPGAEVLCATFRLAPKFHVEDLSDGDCIRYRVSCTGIHQTTGIEMGEGVGECSSNEEKYKWRRATGPKEFAATPEDRKRVKYSYHYQKREEFETLQVRTEPADLANTILKMACKRALVAMTLNVTAASDCFSQDLEDMPEELREAVVERTSKPQTAAPQSSGGDGKATDKQVKLISVKLEQAGVTIPAFCDHFGLEDVEDLPFAKVNDALGWIAEQTE